jgi:hypothetical protein
LNSSLDFLNRRQWLGTTGALGLNLWALLRAQAAAEPGTASPPARIRACIFLFQYGGPSHLDMFDMKPNAPAEIRGEFQARSSSVPGLPVCEHLPRLGRLMHKVALIRSMRHANRLHDAASIESLTGRPLAGGDRELFAPLPQFFPSYGGVVSYFQRAQRHAVAHASLQFPFHNVVDTPCQEAGILGAAFNPFWIQGDPETHRYRSDMLNLPDDLPSARLQERRSLLNAMNGPQGGSDRNARELRRFADRAYQLLESPAIRRALDLGQESDRTRERYGFYSNTRVGTSAGGGLGFGRQIRGQNLLLARRLVEAGVPFVNVYDYRQQGQNWDAHAECFQEHRNYLLPPFDQGMSALIEDLDARGLLDSTLVVAMGEFGRTPRINATAGRDHWPDCYTVFLAGGGIKGGYVHGASDRIGAYPALDPVTPADLAATIFWRFGLDPAAEIHDQTGRPYRLSDGEPIRRLF